MAFLKHPQFIKCDIDRYRFYASRLSVEEMFTGKMLKNRFYVIELEEVNFVATSSIKKHI